jgi:hypothetical protein
MDWQTIIKTVAPWIGTALGGPLGGLAVEAAAAAFGLTEKTTDAVKQALGGATPEQMLALKKADQDFAVQMQALGFKQVADLEKIAADDRASARSREIQTGDRLTPRLLAGIIVGGFLTMVWYVLSGQVSALKDPVAAGLIGTLIGYVSAKADQVVSYYFGSSAGSAEKSALLARK